MLASGACGRHKCLMEKQTLFVTGGAGFIGSCFVEQRVREGHAVICYDALTYAGHKENLSEVWGAPNFTFVQGDIRDGEKVLALLHEHRVDSLLHFAAESHVDNSINGPGVFIDTNVNGTYSLLEAARLYWSDTNRKETFRFLYVSTDEVYGSLGPDGHFSEASPIQPNSPYSASKAAGDLLVRAWHHTYGLPTVITHCTNNYGPRQYPEKLIPVMITAALSGKKLPVYGDGQNVRDWIHVEDHCNGIWLAVTRGTPGEAYDFGGHAEMTNLQLVETLCAVLDEMHPKNSGSYREQIGFVADRLGHDRRYAIDDSKAQAALGYHPSRNFESGLRETITWYLAHREWCDRVTSKAA